MTFRAQESLKTSLTILLVPIQAVPNLAHAGKVGSASGHLLPAAHKIVMHAFIIKFIDSKENWDSRGKESNEDVDGIFVFNTASSNMYCGTSMKRFLFVPEDEFRFSS